MKRWLPTLVVAVAAVATLLVLWLTGIIGGPAPEQSTDHTADHFPRHDDVLPAPPLTAVIDSDLDLTSASIQVETNGIDYASGDTTIDDNKLVARRSLPETLADGLYEVRYELCWIDGTCESGHFRFVLDRTARDGVIDLRGQTSVEVTMDALAFDPARILVSPGTTVTWTNREPLDHYVNTETHPQHTYVLDHNSRALGEGDTFSYTFEKPGAYPYHCSAHADVMQGVVIVE